MAAERTDRPFVEELPRLLEERGLSLREISRRADVSDGHLSRMLRGVGYRTRPSADLARRVAVALDLEPDYFVEFREASIVDAIRSDSDLRESLYDQVTRDLKPNLPRK